VKAVMPLAANAAKDLVFKIREAVPENLFCVIGTVENGRPLISVMISENLVKDHNLNAGAMVREAGKLIQGGGGGQPHYATAGGKKAEGLTAAVDKVLELAKL
ncbi:MAG: alanine--tRNA ligase, partial [Bacteroidaceae bacterium]|nr:alanine--tRNA ligase [Bacteroidaceae bacterium]